MKYEPSVFPWNNVLMFVCKIDDNHHAVGSVYASYQQRIVVTSKELETCHDLTELYNNHNIINPSR